MKGVNSVIIDLHLQLVGLHNANGEFSLLCPWVAHSESKK